MKPTSKKSLDVQTVSTQKHDFNFKLITSESFKNDISHIKEKMKSIPTDYNQTITAIKNEVEQYVLPAVKQFTLYQHFQSITDELIQCDSSYNEPKYLTLSWLKSEIEKYPTYSATEFENQFLLQMQHSFIKETIETESVNTSSPYFDIYFKIDKDNNVVPKDKMMGDLEKQIKNYNSQVK